MEIIQSFIQELLSNNGYPDIENKSLSNIINKLKKEEKKLKKSKRDVEKLTKFYNQQIKMPQKKTNLKKKPPVLAPNEVSHSKMGCMSCGTMETVNNDLAREVFENKCKAE